MFSNIRWQSILGYFFLVALILLLYGGYASSTSCLQSPSCLRRSLFGLVIITAVSCYTLNYILNRNDRVLLQEFTKVIQRITQGETDARILPHKKGEVNDLIRAFNVMTDQLHTQLHVLQEENRQFRTLLSNMSDGVIIADEMGYVQLLNRAATELLNIKETAITGRSFAEAVRNHQLIDIWNKARAAQTEQREAVEIGRDLFLQVTITPYEENMALGYLVLLQDLTQVRHLQTVRRDFVSNISHELRTPLASLKAVVETLQDGALDDPPAAKRFLRRAAGEIDTLTQMVEELLELSRIESGQVPLKVKETAVSELLLIPLDRLKPQASRKNIELSLDVAANLPKVIADEERIQRVVTNLIHNAIKFTPENGSVQIFAKTNDDFPHEIYIAVKDNGMGISKDDLPRIFERFYKSDRARTRHDSSTGLGLAISRHIVQAHNGRIGVNSTEGKGSTFYFTLPIANHN